MVILAPTASNDTPVSSLIRISDVTTMSLVGDWAKKGGIRDQTSTCNCGDGVPRMLPHVEDLLKMGCNKHQNNKILQNVRRFAFCGLWKKKPNPHESIHIQEEPSQKANAHDLMPRAREKHRPQNKKHSHLKFPDSVQRHMELNTIHIKPPQIAFGSFIPWKMEHGCWQMQIDCKMLWGHAIDNF